MAVKKQLRIITKNHVADPGIRFLTKSILKPNGYATAMPTAWELIFEKFKLNGFIFLTCLKGTKGN